MLASYGLSKIIAKLSRPFTRRLFTKDCMLKVAGIVFP